MIKYFTPFLISRRSHKSHEARIITLACTSGAQTFGAADSCEPFAMQPSARFVRSV